MLIEKLLMRFDNCKINEKSDTLAYFNLTFETDSLPELNIFYEVKELLKEYPKRDLFNMCIKSSDNDFFNIINNDGKLEYTGPDYIVKNNNIDEILDNFNRLRVIEDKIEIKIKIEKDYKCGIISIYSLDNFIDWLLNKDIYEMMALFSSIYKSIDNLTFISYDKEVEIITETLQIISDKGLIKQKSINRQSILDSRLDITNIQKMEINIIPEDFNIKKYRYKNHELERRLDCIRDILSIIYIADVSLIGEEFSEFRINGYKSSDFKIFYNDVQKRSKNDQLYDIYRWIYNDGNLIDKSTIARNIVSLHCRYQSILDLDAENLNSIKTNYSYYLKTNTDEFLEEKKNLRLSIIEEGKLLSEALYGFIASMRKNLLAYFTFLATLIISNTLADQKFKDIFTFEIVQIIALVILGSFLFLIASNVEVKHKRTRITDYVDDLIIGYGIMLGEENVRKIIDNVKSYKNVEDTFKHKQALISISWIIFNIILLLILDWISGDIKILGIMNILN